MGGGKHNFLLPLCSRRLFFCLFFFSSICTIIKTHSKAEPVKAGWGGGRGLVAKCVNRRSNLPTPARLPPSSPLKSLASRLIKRQPDSDTCTLTLWSPFLTRPGRTKSLNHNETAVKSLFAVILTPDTAAKCQLIKTK